MDGTTMISETDLKVQVKNLTVRFGAVTVLEELSLDVRKGEFLVLLGASGCGKSTLLNAIAGLQPHVSGQVWIGGRNVTWAEPSERSLSMVFQSYALYPSMTVRGNLSFGLKMAGAPKAEIERAVKTASGLLQIDHLLDRRPHALSGGQRQRVAIGRALVRNSDLFLFDEPLSNLDAKLRSELRVELKKLHQSLAATMIYVTHDQVEALTLADRVAIMKDGVIQQLASPEEVYNRPANLFAAKFIGSPPMNFLRGKLSATGSTRTFETGDLKLPVPLACLDRPMTTPELVDLGFRPEHVFLTADDAPDMLGRVHIDLVEMHGSEQVVWARMGENPIAFRLSPEMPVRPGETRAFGIHCNRFNLYDATSGERI